MPEDNLCSYSLLALTNTIIINASVLEIKKLSVHPPTPKYNPKTIYPPCPNPIQSKIFPTPNPIPSKYLVTCIWVQIYFCFKSTHSMIRASIGYQCTPHWLPNCNDRSTSFTSVTYLWRSSIRNDEIRQKYRKQDSECEIQGILASHLLSPSIAITPFCLSNMVNLSPFTAMQCLIACDITCLEYICSSTCCCC